MKPSFIIPPSRTENGGSSTIALSMISAMSVRSAISAFSSLSIAEFADESRRFISGKRSSVEERARSSREFAVP